MLRASIEKYLLVMLAIYFDLKLREGLFKFDLCKTNYKKIVKTFGEFFTRVQNISMINKNLN